jgi:uncharacterized protein YbjQ (UPF0145 family)
MKLGYERNIAGNVFGRGERAHPKVSNRLDDAKKVGPRGARFHIFKQENPMWNLGRILSSVVMVVTTPTVPGYRVVRTVGPVYGMTIRSRGVGGRFAAGIQGMFGGEITSYVSELENSRRESVERLMENARKVGANAVLSTDFETADILQQDEAVKGRCSNCGAENPPEARFCTKCGTALQ